MYDNITNLRYISPRYTRDDYINLHLNENSPIQTWHSAVHIMRDRIEGRFLRPIDNLLNSDPNANGFAAMALCCLLIEAFMQFRNGFPESESYGNCREYTRFLYTCLNHIFDRDSSKRFYTDIRCGILHSAQTKPNSTLTFNTDYAIKINENDILMVDVQNMCAELKQYFTDYCKELLILNNTDLRLHFFQKMNDISKIYEGTEAIDNLWYAINANYTRLFELPNGRAFYIEIVPGQDVLNIYHHLYTHHGNVIARITKNDLENAIYYWPDKQAINHLKHGNYIYSILYHFSHIVNRIIQDESA